MTATSAEVFQSNLK